MVAFIGDTLRERLVGKILMNRLPVVKFVRFFQRQLYCYPVCAAVLPLKLTKLPLLLSSGGVPSGVISGVPTGVVGDGSSPGMFGSSIICHPR